MSDQLNKNLFSPNSNTSTDQLGVENYEFNHGMEISQFNYGYNDPPIINSDFNTQNANPMMMMMHQNSNIASSFPSGGQLFSNTPIDHNYLSSPIPPNDEDLSSQTLDFDSGEKDDYSLSYILQSAREVCSSMANNNVASNSIVNVSSTLVENTTKANRQLMPRPDHQMETSTVNYNRIFSNLGKAAQNHRNLSPLFQGKQGRMYPRNHQVMENNGDDEGGYSFTVLNSQDPHLPVTRPQFGTSSSGILSRSVGGQVEARRQASSLRQYQLQPQRMSSHQSYSRLSRSSSESGYMRLGGRPLRSSFEPDYEDSQTRSKRGRMRRDESPQQLNPFSYEAQFAFLQRRVPMSIGLSKKLENPLEKNPSDDHTPNIDLSSWRKNSNGASGSRGSLQVEENTPIVTNLEMPPQTHSSLSKDIVVETITGDGDNRCTLQDGDYSKSIDVVYINPNNIGSSSNAGKGKEVDDDAKGNDLVPFVDAENMIGEGDDDFDFIDGSLMATDPFGFDL